MGHARHTSEELEVKLKEMYRQIEDEGLELSTEFNHEKDAWLIHLQKGEQGLTTHLERQDADACLEGKECVHLGVQIGQFIANYKG